MRTVLASPSSRRLSSLILALAFGAVGLDAVALGPAELGAGAARAQSQRQGSLHLSLRRKPKALEVVLEGVGEKPELQQRLNGLIWEARLLTQGKPGLLRGPQTLSLPELGIESVSLNGGGNSYRVVVTPADGQSLSDPTVSADGNDLILTFAGLGTPQVTSARLDLNTPGRVPQPRYAPKLRPRAVAPPLGDMAVGTMVLTNRNYVNVSGPPVTLTLNNAPAKQALMALARLGGYGFVYLGNNNAQEDRGELQDRLVSVAFQEESFSKAFNSVLLAAGLKGRVDGKSLLVGASLANSGFSPTLSKVYRLNQASADSAAQYLASLGARVCVPTTTTFNASSSSTSGTASSSVSQTESSSSEETEINCYGGSQVGDDSGKEIIEGPLAGLEGTTDERLSTVTLIGESRLIAVAERYLRNLDLRKRQVAVKVQILNIDLLNDKSIDTSFSAQIGNTFLVSESGKAFMNFGNQKPGNSSGSGTLGNGTVYSNPGSYLLGGNDFGTRQVQSQAVGTLGNDVFNPQVAATDAVAPQVQAQDVVDAFIPAFDPGVDAEGNPVLLPRYDADGAPVYVRDPNPNASPQLVPRVDSNGQPVFIPTTDPTAQPTFVPRVDANGQPVYVNNTDPTAPLVLRPRVDANGRQIFVQDRSLNPDRTFVPRVDKYGRPIYVAGKDPNEYRQPQDSFLAYVEAVIDSRSAKTLATPTLLVQEGENAQVETGTSVITGVKSTETANGSTQFENTRENAGLNLNVNVLKIDDNGFVTIEVNPSVSVPVPTRDVQNGVQIFNITSRSLSSGAIRLRDRQTLVLTGVIQDSDREVVRKWPILGDLPFLGSLFRSTSTSREKQELVVLVTPSIIDDTQGGSYGYGYRPSTREARQLLGTTR